MAVLIGLREAALRSNQGNSVFRPQVRGMQLHIENPVGDRRFLGLQESDGHIVDANSTRGGSLQRTVMSVAVNDEIGSIAIDNLSQAGAAKVRMDLRRLSDNSGGDWRVMQDNDPLRSPELCHRTPWCPQSLRHLVRNRCRRES